MFRLFFLTTIFAFIAFVPVSATIINIPADYSTIQQGVDMSANGDTVLVHPGNYEENVLISNKGITLGSLFLTTENEEYISSTTLEAGRLEAGIVVENVGGNFQTIINGFTIQNCITTYHNGAGVMCLNANVDISHNIFDSNWGLYGGAIGAENSHVSISYNKMYENQAEEGGGIWALNSELDISYNVIAQNTASAFGAGVYGENSTLIIDKCVISDNRLIQNISYGAGVYADNCVTTVTNTIIWGNSAWRHAQVYSLGPEPSIIYSNIYLGWDGEGNIEDIPHFRDRPNYDYHLKSLDCGDNFNSLCIDAGDPSLFDEFLGCDWGLGEERADMGAYGGNGTPTSVDDDNRGITPEKFELLGNYPNPFNASTLISYSLPSPSDVTVEIFDILGRRVETLVQAEQQVGYHQIVWDADDASSGMYFYRIQAGEFVEARKMVLLK